MSLCHQTSFFFLQSIWNCDKPGKNGDIRNSPWLFGEPLPELQKIQLAAGEDPAVLKSFGWKVGALRRDRPCAEAQLHWGGEVAGWRQKVTNVPTMKGALPWVAPPLPANSCQITSLHPLETLREKRKSFGLGGRKGIL